MKGIHRILLAGLAFVALFGVAPSSSAAATPKVLSVVEGRDTGSGRSVLVLLGSGLTACKSFALTDALGADMGPVILELKSKSMLVLGLPEGLSQGTYILGLGYGKGLIQDHQVVLTNGLPLPGSLVGGALSTDLREDLDDAATLGGQSPSWYRDASNLDAGFLDPALFSAIGDLGAEGKIGLGSGQLAPGNHIHDLRYPLRTDLLAPGTINDSRNPMDWSRLLGVPAGFADGVDNGSVYAAGNGLSLVGSAFTVNFAGTGSALTASRSDHDHSTLYPLKTDLSATGTLNAPGNPVDWTKLKGMPAGFADGTDANAWTEVSGNAYRASGRVGIGTTSPAATLHVSGNDGVLFQGTIGSGSIPTTGSGARMMWYPKKAAFRAGYVGGTEWDDANIGYYSTAMGYFTTASGDSSTAMGLNTIASGFHSTAMGEYTTANGGDSTAMGYGTTASGFNSMGMGYATTASGNYSTATGISTTAQAYGSLVLGRCNVVAGTTSSWVSTEPILVVGNGTSTSSTANAFTLLKNGNLTIAGTLTENSDERLKTEISPMVNVLRGIASIRGVTYRMKDETRGSPGKQIGLLAQEVRAVFPELVHEDAEGTLSVSYGKFSAVLLEAVKEQQAALEKQQAALEAKDRGLAALEARLARLEKLVDGK